MKTGTHPMIKIFLVLFGIGAIYYGIDALRSDSSNWPSVEATIASSRYSASSSDPLNNYEVEYAYQVNNTLYSGYFKNDSNLQTGNKITVYYDPKSPSTSVRSRGEMVLSGVLGILLGLVCLGGLGWGEIKARMTNQPK